MPGPGLVGPAEGSWCCTSSGPSAEICSPIATASGRLYDVLLKTEEGGLSLPRKQGGLHWRWYLSSSWNGEGHFSGKDVQIETTASTES